MFWPREKPRNEATCPWIAVRFCVGQSGGKLEPGRPRPGRWNDAARAARQTSWPSHRKPSGGRSRGPSFPARRYDEGWWTRSGSNRRPRRCERRALSTELLAHEEGEVLGNHRAQVNTNFPSAPRPSPDCAPSAAFPPRRPTPPRLPAARKSFSHPRWAAR